MQDVRLKAMHEHTRQTNNSKLVDADNSMVDTRWKTGEGIVVGKGVKCMVMGEDLSLGGGHTMQ